MLEAGDKVPEVEAGDVDFRSFVALLLYFSTFAPAIVAPQTRHPVRLDFFQLTLNVWRN